MVLAPVASCLSGRAMRRAHHQMISSEMAATGREFFRTPSIRASSEASVADLGRWATMPQPVEGMML
ncbi:hypothetical protein D3C80_2184460 [compost metagenome]